jgi:3-oxoacyl-[acyl-carrier protein] reductase
VNCYVFGASGEIGTSITKRFKAEKYQVFEFSRTSENAKYISITEIPKDIEPADCVVWASGSNLNDSISDYDAMNLHKLLEANLFYIVETLNTLIQNSMIKKDCSLVIVSSVWQLFSKQNKLSYTISKSALQGLIHSLTADLSSSGIRVNAVLPGVVDTGMSREALSDIQIKKIKDQTPSGHLVSLNDVANATFFLATPQSKGINGQSLLVDGGWSVVRYV